MQELSGRHDYKRGRPRPMPGRRAIPLSLSTVMAIPAPLPPSSRPVRETRDTNKLDRYAFWFFAVTLLLAALEMCWRILGL